jgi:peptide/nickel transport system substrate-binding protein
VVPPTTPRRPLGPRAPAGTGPYRIERVVPGRQVLLARNPHFQPRGPDGRPAGFADRIAVTMGNERSRARAVERGDLDFTRLFNVTARRLTGLRTRGDTRLHSAAGAFTEYAWLNVHAPPFDDVRVRRAVNLAVDRTRMVNLTGGPDAGSPTCQLLPAGLPGYRPLCSFTVAPSPTGAWIAPDVARAKRLIAAAGARGAPVEVATWSWRRGMGRELNQILRTLGFRSHLRVYKELTDAYTAALRRQEPAQIGIDGWIADYLEPAAFLRTLISCDAYVPGDNIRTTNFSRFCDPGIDAAIDRAQTAGVSAGDAWPRIERRIAAHAPVVPLVNRRTVVVTSRRAGNLQFHPLAGPMLDQVWVR